MSEQVSFKSKPILISEVFIWFSSICTQKETLQISFSFHINLSIFLVPFLVGKILYFGPSSTLSQKSQSLLSHSICSPSILYYQWWPYIPANLPWQKNKAYLKPGCKTLPWICHNLDNTGHKRARHGHAPQITRPVRNWFLIKSICVPKYYHFLIRPWPWYQSMYVEKQTLIYH